MLITVLMNKFLINCNFLCDGKTIILCAYLMFISLYYLWVVLLKMDCFNVLLIIESLCVHFQASRHALVWSACAGAAVPLLLPVVVTAEEGKECCCKHKIRPSQLPIYEEPEDLYELVVHSLWSNNNMNIFLLFVNLFIVSMIILYNIFLHEWFKLYSNWLFNFYSWLIYFIIDCINVWVCSV